MEPGTFVLKLVFSGLPLFGKAASVEPPGGSLPPLSQSLRHDTNGVASLVFGVLP